MGKHILPYYEEYEEYKVYLKVTLKKKKTKITSLQCFCLRSVSILLGNKQCVCNALGVCAMAPCGSNAFLWAKAKCL